MPIKDDRFSHFLPSHLRRLFIEIATLHGAISVKPTGRIKLLGLTDQDNAGCGGLASTRSLRGPISLVNSAIN